MATSYPSGGVAWQLSLPVGKAQSCLGRGLWEQVSALHEGLFSAVKPAVRSIDGISFCQLWEV